MRPSSHTQTRTAGDPRPRPANSPTDTTRWSPRADDPADSTKDESFNVEPDLLRALPQLATCLQERYPAASSALVQRCIDQAIVGFRDVTVRKYLPILVERSALDALPRCIAAARSERCPWSSGRRRVESSKPLEGEPTPRLTTATTNIDHNDALQRHSQVTLQSGSADLAHVDDCVGGPVAGEDPTGTSARRPTERHVQLNSTRDEWDITSTVWSRREAPSPPWSPAVEA